MRPPARVQSAIEILDRVIDAAKSGGAPADRIVALWAREHRFAGSKDRRAIRDLVYDAIRVCGPVPADGRAAMLRLVETGAVPKDLFDGSEHGPAPIGPDEKPAKGGFAPSWLAKRFAASDIRGAEGAALLDRAPLDVRVNTLKTAREALELPFDAEPTAAAQGLRLPQGSPVEQSEAYRDGLIEVQDTGSQFACQSVGATPGELVIDLCAGAGGKSLHLAAMMDNNGRLIAADIDRRRLSNLPPRISRSGARMIEGVLLNPGQELEALGEFAGKADRVLIDAPCSGTGTWRRKPEARWRLTPERLAAFAQAQDALLDLAAKLARPGGSLHFVTCSLLDEEGADRAGAFLVRHRGWKALTLDLPAGQPRGHGVRLTPHHDGTDGFFIAGFGSP